MRQKNDFIVGPVAKTDLFNIFNYNLNVNHFADYTSRSSAQWPDYTSRSSAQWPHDITSQTPYPQGSTGYSQPGYSTTSTPTSKPPYSSPSPSYPGYSAVTWSPRWQYSTTAWPKWSSSTTSMPYYADAPCRQVNAFWAWFWELFSLFILFNKSFVLLLIFSPQLAYLSHCVHIFHHIFNLLWVNWMVWCLAYFLIYGFCLIRVFLLRNRN